MKKQQLGKAGEELACRLLKKQGYHLLEKNYRCRHGEIDIVARHKNTLVFVEVRGKSGVSFGSPEESVTGLKRQRLVAAALDYIGSHEGLPEDWRIDLVAIQFDPAGQRPVRAEILQNVID